LTETATQIYRESKIKQILAWVKIITTY
jgi:hypothetical protein